MKEPSWLMDERSKTADSSIDISIKQPKTLEFKKSKNVRIHRLSEMLEKDPKFAKNVFLNRKIKSGNPYADYLNSKFNECNFIFVDKGKKAELEILSDNSLSINFVFLGEGSSLRLSTIVISDSLNIIETTAGEKSRLDAGFLKHKEIFAYHAQHNRAETGSKINSACFWSGNGTGENKTELHGVESKALHIEFSTGGDNETIALDSDVSHLANDSESEVIMRGVAEDSSVINFKGNVKVETNGRGSKSSLKQEILLLDENARADAKPVLEIKNNDVECSHSAAVREIEKEKLFYLMSRGLSRNSAKTTMIIGFLRNAMNRIEDKELRNMFMPPFMQD